MRAKLAEVKDQLKRRRHLPVPEQGRWLASVVRGHLAYYAVPGNFKAILTFRVQVTRHWLKALRRRSQRHRLNWERMDDSLSGTCPLPASCIPTRRHALPLAPKAGAQCGNSARWDLRGGPPARAVPTATGRFGEHAVGTDEFVVEHCHVRLVVLMFLPDWIRHPRGAAPFSGSSRVYGPV
ncbi:MAG: hypothetical protein M3460_28475 [Actinomycetota bacterium]|nr:hypothetical protein [Actinomycetota bacterium]